MNSRKDALVVHEQTNPLLGACLEQARKLPAGRTASGEAQSARDIDSPRPCGDWIIDRSDGVVDGELLLLDGDGDKLAQRVRAGTASGLAVCLVELYRQDWGFVRAYLDVYRDFQRPAELLDVLTTRYRLKSAGDGWRRQIQSRVLAVVDVWLAEHAHDFVGGQLVEPLLDFLDQVQRSNVDKFQISAKAGELRQRADYLRTPRRSLGAMLPSTVSLQRLADELGRAAAGRPAGASLPLLSESVAVVLSCGVCEALEWTLLLTQRGYLLPVEPATAPSPSPSPSPASASPPASPSKTGKKDALRFIRPPKLARKTSKSLLFEPPNPYAADAGDATEDELLVQHMRAEAPPERCQRAPAVRRPSKVKLAYTRKRRGSVVLEVPDDDDAAPALSGSKLSRTAEALGAPMPTRLLGAAWTIASAALAPTAINPCLDDRCSVDGLARDLTALAGAAFCRVRPHELTSVRWTRPDAALHCPAVTALTHCFNKLSCWVATSVLRAASAEQRCAVVVGVLRLAKRLWRLGNLHCLMAVLAGLEMNVVGRLKATWALLSEQQHARYHCLAELFSPCKNYRLYRALLDRHTAHAAEPTRGWWEPNPLPPAAALLPYFGVHTRDLFFINESVQRTVASPGPAKLFHSVAFITTAGAVLADVRRQQRDFAEDVKMRSDGRPEPLVVLDPCLGVESLSSIDDEDELYQMSVAAEPPQNALLLSIDAVSPVLDN